MFRFSWFGNHAAKYRFNGSLNSSCDSSRYEFASPCSRNVSQLSQLSQNTSMDSIHGYSYSSYVVSGPFKATQIWNEIISHLQHRVEVKRRRYKIRYYENCFTGTDAVDVVLQFLLEDRDNFGVDISREKAIKLCQALMDRHVFYGVGIRQSECKKPQFDDSNGKIYRFPGWDCGKKGITDDDSEDDSDVDSDDERMGSDVESTESSPRGEEMRMNPDLEPDILGDGIICNPLLLSTRKGPLMDEVIELRKNLKRKSMAAVRKSAPNLKLARRFSFQDGLSVDGKPFALPPGYYDDIWREVALSKLLTLIDLPILDGLLCEEKTARKSMRFNLVISNSVLKHYGSKSSTGCGVEDAWVQTAMDVLEGLPKGLSSSILEKDCSGPITPETKLSLFHSIVDHYTSLGEPLFPERFIDLHLAILNLVLQQRDSIAREALQLDMILLPWHRTEEIQRLLRFMAAVSNDQECMVHNEDDNLTSVINQFTDLILRHKVLSHNLATLFIGFMLANIDRVFLIPKDVREKVNVHLSQMKEGILQPVLEETYCDRLTDEEYRKQTEETTQLALRDIMNNILDDTKIPLKEKKNKLKQFQKFHPHMYAKYFADMC